MHQSQVVVLISDNDCIKERKHLEISYDTIYGESPNTWTSSTTTNCKYCYGFLLSAEVELILLIRVAKLDNLLAMSKFIKFESWEVLIVEVDFVASNDSNAG